LINVTADPPDGEAQWQHSLMASADQMCMMTPLGNKLQDEIDRCGQSTTKAYENLRKLPKMRKQSAGLLGKSDLHHPVRVQPVMAVSSEGQSTVVNETVGLSAPWNQSTQFPK
jgi:hypothetical protein